MGDKVDSVEVCFRSGYGCSQAVFATFAGDLGLESETALRIAGAFGGGMSRLDQTCGAVTGALMVIGLKYGKSRADDAAASQKTSELAREFAERFKARHGSITCTGLLDCNLSTPEGRQVNEEQRRSATRCSAFVRDVAEILADIL